MNMKVIQIPKNNSYYQRIIDSLRLFSFTPLVVALGLLFVAFAFNGARHNESWSETLFWVGLSIQFVVVAVKLLGKRASRLERIGILIELGLCLYLVKVFHSPVYFTFHDEFAHWKTTYDIITTAHLFISNSLIPISPLYPGLEIATAALSSLSSLSIFDSGIIIIGAARILLVLSLFLLYEQITRSSRLASIATLLYMATNHFVFWLAQYSYESLALPLGVFTLYLMIRRVGVRGRIGISLSLMIILSIGAVIITHHLTSYALIAFLVIWICAISIQKVWDRLRNVRGKRTNAKDFRENKLENERIKNESFGAATQIYNTTQIALVLCFTWLIYVAQKTIYYLSPALTNGIHDIVSMIGGEISIREFFLSPTGWVNPYWEQVVLLSNTILLLFGISLGIFIIWRKWDKSAAITLSTIALFYPISLIGRLLSFGIEISSRLADFIFLCIALVVGVAIEVIWEFPGIRKFRYLIVVPSMTIIFLGGVIIGWPTWARLPGSYLVVSDTRSIESQGIMAAKWALSYLGSDQRMAADRINTVLMGSYGDQNMVRVIDDGQFVASVFFAPQLGEEEKKILEEGKIRYLVIDRRLSTDLPGNGIYFDVGEPDTYQHHSPINLNALMKFDGYPIVSRIFDSGDILIFDVGDLSHAP